jgi:hypothetical protein
MSSVFPPEPSFLTFGMDTAPHEAAEAGNSDAVAVN